MARSKSEFLKAFGTAFEVWKAIVDTVLSKGGSDEHIRSLIGDKTRLASIAAIIIGAGISELPPDHYRAYADYAPLPSMSDLEQDYSGKGSVSVIFDGRPWEKHAECVGMDETPGEKNFYLAAPPPEVLGDSEKIIAWGKNQHSDFAPNGYRPATHLEAIAFAKAHPELQRQFWIVALGSFALYDGLRLVAALRAVGVRRLLHAGWFDSWWRAGCRFLFVRK